MECVAFGVGGVDPGNFRNQMATRFEDDQSGVFVHEQDARTPVVPGAVPGQFQAHGPARQVEVADRVEFVEVPQRPPAPAEIEGALEPSPHAVGGGGGHGVEFADHEFSLVAQTGQELDLPMGHAPVHLGRPVRGIGGFVPIVAVHAVGVRVVGGAGGAQEGVEGEAGESLEIADAVAQGVARFEGVESEVVEQGIREGAVRCTQFPVVEQPHHAAVFLAQRVGGCLVDNHHGKGAGGAEPPDEPTGPRDQRQADDGEE